MPCALQTEACTVLSLALAAIDTQLGSHIGPPKFQLDEKRESYGCLLEVLLHLHYPFSQINRKKKLSSLTFFEENHLCFCLFPFPFVISVYRSVRAMGNIEGFFFVFGSRCAWNGKR